MEKNKKIEVTEEIKTMLNDSTALYFTDFTGMTVAEANELRDEFHKSNIKYRVVKNTLLKRALGDSDNYSEQVEEFSKYLVGPTGVIFAGEDPFPPPNNQEIF
jgi:Ribosomal protein L10